eukprot:10217076-Karenia_brevis.AAC.1
MIIISRHESASIITNHRQTTSSSSLSWLSMSSAIHHRREPASEVPITDTLPSGSICRWTL